MNKHSYIQFPLKYYLSRLMTSNTIERMKLIYVILPYIFAVYHKS